MLKTRVIPTLLTKGGALVKGRAFASDRIVGHARQAARIHDMRGVDELVILDVAATAREKGPDLRLVRDISNDCLMPLTVGGGVRSVNDVRDLLAAGADKVAICTAAYHSPSIILDAAKKFGSQAIVGVVDFKDGGGVFINSGKLDAAITPLAAAKMMETWGAGEILLTSIDRDGTMAGYDLDMIEKVASNVMIPVVASGGCSGWENMAEAIDRGAHAVAAGALFQFTNETPRGAAAALDKRGYKVRIEA